MSGSLAVSEEEHQNSKSNSSFFRLKMSGPNLTAAGALLYYESFLDKEVCLEDRKGVFFWSSDYFSSFSSVV